MQPRAGTVVVVGQANILRCCPACGSKIGEPHKSYCDAAYHELLEYQRWLDAKSHKVSSAQRAEG